MRARIKRLIKKSPFFPWCLRWVVNPFKRGELAAMLKHIPRNARRGLDFGCGSGHHVASLADRFGRLIGIDINPVSIAKAGELATLKNIHNAEFLAGNVHGMNFEDEYFDCVISFCVLEHVVDLERVLLELRRIMKPGSFLVASVDTLSTIKDDLLLGVHKVDHHVVRYFSAGELERVLVAAGFQLQGTEPVFTSRAAASLFKAGIRRRFSFGILSGLATSLVLFLSELMASRQDNDGIMLVFKAKRV